MATIEKPEVKTKMDLPDAQGISQVLEVVGRATSGKRPTLSQSEFERKLSAFGEQMMAHIVPAGLLMLLTALLALVFRSHALLNTMLVLAILCELLVLSMMLSNIVGSTPFLWRLRKEPYAPFLELVEKSSAHDLHFMDELSMCRKEAVQYLVVQYKQERNGYERRSGMLAGAIDKVGIIPALAGLVITFSNLMKVSDSIAWGSFFGPLLLIFYVQAIATAQMIQKMDRVIALLELSLQVRK